MAKLARAEPLTITCTSADCADDLHCFKQLKRMKPEERGKCRFCGADLIDWERVRKGRLEDAAHTFEMLQHELIRHHFFHRDLDDTAARHAQRKGRSKLLEAARARLRKHLAPAMPPYDGRQTPFGGNCVFYAQHATATCCRTCLEYWHGIEKGRMLADDELEYCLQLIELFLDQRLPKLNAEPMKVPRRRRKQSELR